ncbi:hypothetical protein K2173_021220 [Erythroxylum novogranatense]|uniref:YTH domain-containing family protein n=1 Tax=Erythroxylum novogranatense TaxID=1862640 RepID=A0AAV8TMW6_9ROSI|nr:hypothetical protein K2173_021220 [Erythroxylum novogranatense]
METDSKLNKTEVSSAGLNSVSAGTFAEKDVTSVEDGAPSGPTFYDSSLGAVTLSSKGNVDASCPEGKFDRESIGEPGLYFPPTSSYSYHYPGFLGSCAQVDNPGYSRVDGYHTSMVSENGSVVYYVPSYNTYTSGTVGVDGQSVGQQPYYPAYGYVQPHLSYGCDATYVADGPNASGVGNRRYGSSSATLAKSRDINAINNKYSKSIPGEKIRTFGKGYHPVGKLSSFTGQKQGSNPRNELMNHRQDGRLWNEADRIRAGYRFNGNGDYYALMELPRGPRASNRSPTLEASIMKQDCGSFIHRDRYNLPNFEIEYSDAKFYVIKSYSEDDIHKSIKYDVWSSTPRGNKKLDAAFHDAEKKSSDAGMKCPIFLFFSVNGSGQFVGLAEMVGQVDFNKDMGFWRVDKWHGFFPVKWHVIKDIPNHQLRHIILENDENSSVTFSRDTQEVGLKQGLQMLNIFKSYAAKSSLLDDFDFYENREKSLNAKKGRKPGTLQMEEYENMSLSKHGSTGGKLEQGKNSTDTSSLVKLAKNLSIHEPNSKISTKSTKRSIPVVAPEP